MSGVEQPSAPGSKKIVICLDGTDNEIGVNKPTNPAKVYEMLDLQYPTKQVGYYDPGVGTMPSANARGAVGKWVSRFQGLAFGSGMRTNLTQAYTYLMQQWKPGDKIYIFGFSRGAYTARALAGMLTRPGLMRPGSENLVPYAVSKYAVNRTLDEAALLGIEKFSRAFCWGTESNPLSPERPADQYHTREHCVPVEYLGVWDTVKAAGVLRIGDLRWPFTHDLPNVKRGRHAVSIDEKRRPYREFLVSPGNENVSEVWFAGVHSDVGGTFEQHELAKVSLKWVFDGASSDIDLRPGAYARRCGVLPSFADGDIHDMGILWTLAGVRHRPLPAEALLHETVKLRRQNKPGYLPTLPWKDGVQRWEDDGWMDPTI